MSTSDPLTRGQIRVFISSTFRDMHAERDHLVKVVFPELRKLCESRGVAWVEVDLRWGVTDEAAAEGRVLPICLEEIHRCRPYFIGLLGDRYGWVPQSIPDELLEKESWLREQFRKRKSVTEFEIIHGVLRNPDMAEHAFFYFRDPAWIDHLPSNALRTDFISEDAASAAKLRRLKELIRASGLPVRENYPTPEAVGKLVLADLTKVINELYPEGSQPDPLTREAMAQAAFARSRERVYIGRPEYFDRLDAHVCGEGDQHLVIVGESGSGKSALLANWAARHRQAHPEVFVLEHYIGSTPSSTDWTGMVRRIMGELKRRFGLAQHIPDTVEALRVSFDECLQAASAQGRVVLLLDALNQLEDHDGAPDMVWLPLHIPRNVRLITSALPGRTLDELMRREWATLQIEPLEVKERATLIREHLALYAKQLSVTQAKRITESTQGTTPLYLRALLEEMRIFGKHEDLDSKISYYLAARTVSELYEKILDRYERDYERDRPGLVRDAMSLLWVARRGLSEAELLDMLAPGFRVLPFFQPGELTEVAQIGQPLPHAHWSPLYLAVESSLVNSSGLLNFAHDHLRKAVEHRYLDSEAKQREAHRRLAALFWWEKSSTRRSDELFWQLAQAGEWHALYECLAHIPELKEQYRFNPFAVTTYWTQIESHSDLRALQAYRAVREDPGRFSSSAIQCVAAILDHTGHSRDALSLQQYLTQRDRESNDRARLIISLVDQAITLRNSGDFDKALALCRESEQLCRELDDKAALARTLSVKGGTLRDENNLDEAIAVHREAESVYFELGDKRGRAMALTNQALSLFDQGDLEGALTLYRRTEQEFRELGERPTLSITLENQAMILRNLLYRLGRSQPFSEAAMPLCKEQERIYRELGDEKELARSIAHQAYICNDAGKFADALALFAESEQIFKDLGMLEEAAACLWRRARILEIEMDRPLEADPLYKEADSLRDKAKRR